jgi:hypothetical protein
MLPPVLYKYEALTEQSLRNLKNQILYFGSPLQFNDPYDCALTPNIRPPTDEEAESIRRAYLEGIEMPLSVRQDLSGLSGQAVVGKTADDFLKTCGATCFSERNDHLLMWSHYGGRYRGFCLEFATAFEPFSKIRKVVYRSDLPTIELAPILLLKSSSLILDLFCTKSEVWSYEMEWRALHTTAGTAYVYAPECLTGVYFGPDISLESLEIVCLILSGQNERVKFWRGVRSTTEFKVLFKEFTYTSHLEAKRKGRC